MIYFRITDQRQNSQTWLSDLLQKQLASRTYQKLEQSQSQKLRHYGQKHHKLARQHQAYKPLQSATAFFRKSSRSLSYRSSTFIRPKRSVKDRTSCISNGFFVFIEVEFFVIFATFSIFFIFISFFNRNFGYLIQIPKMW